MAENLDTRTIGRFPPRMKAQQLGDGMRPSESPIAYMMNGNGQISPVMATKSGVDGAWGSIDYSGSITSPYTPVPIQSNVVGFAYASTVSVWVARCIEIRSTGVSRIKRNLIDRRTNKPVFDHPYAVAVRRARQQGQDIYSLWQRSKCVFGEVFIWPQTNEFGYKSDLRWLNNVGMNVQQGAGFIYSYSYSPITGGLPMTFNPEDLAHYMIPNWFNDLRGQSPLDTILLEIGIDKDVSRYTKAYFANDARPGLMLIPEVDLSQESAQAFMDYWKLNFQGTANAGRPMMMPHVIKDVKEVQKSPDVDSVEIRESMRREICARFGVPLSVAGAWDDANYQSAPEQRRSLYEETIIPECDDLDMWATEALLPYFDDTGRYAVKSDFTDVKALIEDESVKSNVSNQRLLAGGITRDEYRRESGKPPLPGEDVLYIPQGVNIVPVSQAGQAFTQPQPGMIPLSPTAQQLPPSAPPTPNALPISQPPAADTVAVDKVERRDNQLPTKSASNEAYVCIPLPNDPQLIAIQNRVREQLGDAAEYQDPKTFHVTMVYCNTIADEDLQAIVDKRIQFTEHSITSTSLGLFDNPNERALHIKVDSNPSLMDTQRALYDLFVADGHEAQLSDYSKPAKYTPHITLAYLSANVPMPALDFKLQTVANRVDFTRNGYVVFDTLPANSHAPVPIKSIVQPSALDELAAWKKKAMNGGVEKAFTFVCYTLPKDTESLVRSGLKFNMDKTALKAVFDGATEALKKNLVPPDEADYYATPEEYQAYWGEYDKLMEQLGNEWLNDYMLPAFEATVNHITATNAVEQLDKALEGLHNALVDKWLGTSDKPGVVTQIAYAGMGAANTALLKNKPANPEKAVKAIALNVDWALVSKEAHEFAQVYTYNLIKNLDATTLKEVQKIISQWVASGGSVADLRKLLEPVFNNPVRAQMIAATESTRVFNEGAQARWANVGVTKQKWLTVRDSHVCPSCKELYGKIGIVGVGWESSMGIVNIPLHPQCRCFSRPVIDETTFA